MPNSNINWMVPLRRAVVEGQGVELPLKGWLEQLRDTDNSFVLGIWYRYPGNGDCTPAGLQQNVR